MVILWKRIYNIQKFSIILIKTIQWHLKSLKQKKNGYSLENANKFDIKTRNINKLITNLISKKNYVVHYRNL